MTVPASSRRVVALLGPTASGKTAAAVAVARRLPIEVVAADSRQLRRGMVIGTAAPTAEELAAVPHHLTGIIEPDADWSLADWLRRAREAMEDIWSRGRLPLLTGGTGQYVWALLEGWSVPAVPPNPARRRELEAIAAREGDAALHRRLARADPASAERIDARNVRRVIRALEIVEATGAPVPLSAPAAPDFAWRAVGLRWPRDTLYARADERVEAMYAAGLVEETRGLLERYGGDFPALQSIGYAEALRVVQGDWDVSAAMERTMTETHRLIRMQAAWFREDDERIEWVDGADLEAVVAAVEAAARPPVR